MFWLHECLAQEWLRTLFLWLLLFLIYCVVFLQKGRLLLLLFQFFSDVYHNSGEYHAQRLASRCLTALVFGYGRNCCSMVSVFSPIITRMIGFGFWGCSGEARAYRLSEPAYVFLISDLFPSWH